MNTRFASSLLFACLSLGACASSSTQPPTAELTTPSNTTEPAKMTTAKGNADILFVEAPVADAVVQSPLRVRGRARGTWYFEASFPVKLLDADGRVLVQAPAQAQGEWMTEAYVPFEVELSFDAKGATTGTLVLEKDNASGLPEHADELRLPVRFETK